MSDMTDDDSNNNNNNNSSTNNPNGNSVIYNNFVANNSILNNINPNSTSPLLQQKQQQQQQQQQYNHQHSNSNNNNTLNLPSMDSSADYSQSNSNNPNNTNVSANNINTINMHHPKSQSVISPNTFYPNSPSNIGIYAKPQSFSSSHQFQHLPSPILTHTRSFPNNGNNNNNNNTNSSKTTHSLPSSPNPVNTNPGTPFRQPNSPSFVPISLNPEVLDRINKFRSDCLDNLYTHQCHNLIPHSGKVVVFDSRLRVRHAFDGLLVHDINCAPVYDSNKRKYVGMLSVSDFLDILLQTYNENDKTAFMNLSNQRILDWAEFKKARGTSINRLLCISPESTLHEAVRQLLNYRVHRLCVVQLALADTVLRILTNHGILRFLRNNCRSLDTVTVRDLGIGVFRNLLTINYSTPLMKALEMLSSYKVSSIPVVNENNIPVDLYSRSDVRFLAMDNSWTHLDMTVEQALAKHQKGRVLPLCTRDDTIQTVAGLLVSTMKHSLICVDPTTGQIEGVVSLTDILSFLTNSGPPKAESRIAALKNENENIDPVLMMEQQAKQNRIIQSGNNNNNNNNTVPPSPAIPGRRGSQGPIDDSESIIQMGDIDPEEDFLR